MIPCTFSPAVYRTLLPRPRVRAVDWAEAHVPAPALVQGLLRFDLFPYSVEVLDCLDSPDIDTVTLQWASRTGKTTLVQAWLLKEIATNPGRAFLWAEPDRPSLARCMARTWRMIDRCDPLAEKALPRHLRSNTQLRFADTIVFGAYSGSPSTAADEACPGGAILNELDKYSHRRRLDREGESVGEADFPDLCRERIKGACGAKLVLTSTPSIKGRSRIEAERLNGDRRQFYVPCPHCGHFQTLRTGRTKREHGGIKFDKGRDGHLDVETARATAYYECEACRNAIADDHRYRMINAGRWVREGQSIDKHGKIRGTPLGGGRHASFGPLGTHYSLLPDVTWGQIAAQYVSELTNPLKSNLQNFTNSWEGATFDPTPPETTAGELALRLASDIPRGTIPEDARFLSLGVDVGLSGTDLLFFWMLCAWRNDATGHVCDWGAATGERELWTAYDQCAQGKLPIVTGIDSGGGSDERGDAVTERVYQLCRGRREVHPIKGSSAWRSSTDWYSLGFQRSGATPRELKRKRKAGVGDLILMSTTLTQSWRESLVYGRLKPGEAGFVTLPVEVRDQPDVYEGFLGELTSDTQIAGRWQKRPGQPNEYGDTLRICRMLAELFTRGGKLWGRLPDKAAARIEVTGSAVPSKQSAKPNRFSLLGDRERPRLSPH